jgi:hypothetical protein
MTIPGPVDKPTTEQPVTSYEVSAPDSVMMVSYLAFVAEAVVFGGFAVLVGPDKGWPAWQLVLLAVALFLVVQGMSIQVPWWGTVAVTSDGFTVTRRRGVVALAKAPWSGKTVVRWRDVDMERAIVGRVTRWVLRDRAWRDFSRVTFHVSPAAAAAAWNMPPFAGFAPYREGALPFWLHRDRGFAWTLGDLDAPVDEVETALRASLPATVEVTSLAKHALTPRYHGPRRTRLVSFLLIFGGLEALLWITH